MKYKSKITQLQKSLSQQSEQKTKKWFEDYLKGAIKYRGIKTPQVAKILKIWRIEHQLDKLSATEQLELAANLIRQNFAEDKFAGILYMQKFLLERIDFEDFAKIFESLFAESHFYDWSTTDWFNVRVLSPLINIHERKAVKRFTAWYQSESLWQRRSSIVSLRACVKWPEYIPVLKKQITRMVKSEERFIQTGIGWVIADLSKVNPTQADLIVDKHLKHLSLEVIKRHTKHLANHKHFIKQKKAL